MRTLTLAVSKPECRVLLRLARLDLAATIHVAMTAELPPKNKTFYALNKVDAYLAVTAMLSWRPEDKQVAYRAVPVPIMDYLMVLVHEANTKTMDEQDLQEYLQVGPSLIANLEMARTVNLKQPIFKTSTNIVGLDS